MHRKKNCSLCPLGILEGNICNLRPFILTRKKEGINYMRSLIHNPGLLWLVSKKMEEKKTKIISCLEQKKAAISFKVSFLFLTNFHPTKQSIKSEINQITSKLLKTTNLCISTYSISPEKEKNSFISCSDAPKETLLTFTVLICNQQEQCTRWKACLYN